MQIEKKMQRQRQYGNTVKGGGGRDRIGRDRGMEYDAYVAMNIWVGGNTKDITTDKNELPKKEVKRVESRENDRYM